MHSSIRRLVTLAFLAAVSVVLCYTVRFPIFPAAPWLEYEPADVPLMLAAFVYGPWWALGLTAIVCALQAFTVSAASGFIGFVMHLCATGAFVTAAGLLFRTFSKRGKDGAVVLPLICGSVLAIALMVPLNLLLTPLYGVPVSMVKELMFPAILPFNALKFGVNAVLAGLLFRALRGYLRTRG